MNEKITELNDAYYKAFSELKDSFEYLPPDQYKKMCEVLHREYVREYELLDGEMGIATDKQIERLHIKRDEEIEKIRLEHVKLTADIAAERKALESEIDINRRIAEAKAAIKENEVVPADLPRRWWQRRARPNRAKQLALRESYLDIANYFAQLEECVQRRENEGYAPEIESLLSAALPHPRGKRARAMQNQAIEMLALQINAEIERRVKEQSEDSAEADGIDVPPQIAEDIAIANEKPKRKRRRKSEIEQTDSEEQIEGQMAIEELGNATDKSPELAQTPEETQEQGAAADYPLSV